ncbi:hypothetical protein SESBI_36191 [Sesbania bispinosa]|nr:hypothetical protein SESBI_36191 [Sesbania bispinosa]
MALWWFVDVVRRRTWLATQKLHQRRSCSELEAANLVLLAALAPSLVSVEALFTL